MQAFQETHLQRPLRHFTQQRENDAQRRLKEEAASLAAEEAETTGSRRGAWTRKPALARESSMGTTSTIRRSLAVTSDYHGNHYWPPVAAAHAEKSNRSSNTGGKSLTASSSSSSAPCSSSDSYSSTAANATLATDLLAREALLRYWASDPVQAAAPRPSSWAEAKDRGRTFVNLRDGDQRDQRLWVYAEAWGLQLPHQRTEMKRKSLRHVTHGTDDRNDDDLEVKLALKDHASVPCLDLRRHALNYDALDALCSLLRSPLTGHIQELLLGRSEVFEDLEKSSETRASDSSGLDVGGDDEREEDSLDDDPEEAIDRANDLLLGSSLSTIETRQRKRREKLQAAKKHRGGAYGAVFRLGDAMAMHPSLMSVSFRGFSTPLPWRLLTGKDYCAPSHPRQGRSLAADRPSSSEENMVKGLDLSSQVAKQGNGRGLGPSEGVAIACALRNNQLLHT